MSDDVAIVGAALRGALADADAKGWSGRVGVLRDAAAAFGRVVAERDDWKKQAADNKFWAETWAKGQKAAEAELEELRVRLQRSDAEVVSLRAAWTYAHISSPDAQEQAFGGASGASSTAALHHVLEEATERWNTWGTPLSLRAWLGLTEDEYSAYVECRMDDLIASLAARAEVSGGTSTGSARPPQLDVVALSELVDAYQFEAMDARARVVLLEEALRAAEEAAVVVWHQASVGSGQVTGAALDALSDALVAARAALVGDAPPATEQETEQCEADLGAPPARAEEGRDV